MRKSSRIKYECAQRLLVSVAVVLLGAALVLGDLDFGWLSLRQSPLVGAIVVLVGVLLALATVLRFRRERTTHRARSLGRGPRG